MKSIYQKSRKLRRKMDKITELLKTIDSLKAEVEADHQTKLVALTNANKDHLVTLAQIQEENKIKEEIEQKLQEVNKKLDLVEQEKQADATRKTVLEQKEKEYQSHLQNIQNMLKA